MNGPVRKIARALALMLSGAFANAASADEVTRSSGISARMTFNGVDNGKSTVLREIFGEDFAAIPATARFGLTSDNNKITFWESEECTILLEDEGQSTVTRLQQQFDRAAFDRNKDYYIPKSELHPGDINPRSVLPSIPDAVAKAVAACGMNF